MWGGGGRDWRDKVIMTINVLTAQHVMYSCCRLSPLSVTIIIIIISLSAATAAQISPQITA